MDKAAMIVDSRCCRRLLRTIKGSVTSVPPPVTAALAGHRSRDRRPSRAAWFAPGLPKIRQPSKAAARQPTRGSSSRSLLGVGRAVQEEEVLLTIKLRQNLAIMAYQEKSCAVLLTCFP